MTMVKSRRLATGFAAATMIAVGVAAPAFAEGHRQSYMNNWHDGDASSNWTDRNLDSTNTRVTFKSCTREFRATIRKTVTGPDPKISNEWIDCRSYADAVYGGDLGRANYHFDVTGMGFAWCASGQCQYNLTDVPELHIYW